MPAFTVRYRPAARAQQCTALEEFARGNGATVTWSADNAYALVEGCAPFAVTGATVFESPVIALAIRPNVAEALPVLEQALAGSGRPGGVIDALRDGDRVIVEWNLDRTPASVMLALIDVELARFKASRVNQLLSPLPLAWWTALAAEGLQAPEIAPDRVLESLIEEQHVVS